MAQVGEEAAYAASTEAVEDGVGQQPSPPCGVFDLLGVMELERRGPEENARHGDHDSAASASVSASDEESDEECGSPNASEGYVEPQNSSDGDNVLIPSFNSKGKFLDYETRGDQEIQRRAVSGRFKGGTLELDEREREYSILLSRTKKRDRKYAFMSIIIVFIVGSILWFTLSWDDNEDKQISSSPDYVGQESQIDGNNDEQSSSYPAEISQEQLHTAQEKTESSQSSTNLHNHDPHTHPKKEHSPRNSQSPTPSPVTPPSFSMTAAAVATVKKSQPSDKWGGLEELCIERDERISFVRFDWPSTIFSGDDVVAKAVLKLYLKTHSSDNAVTTVVLVDALPFGGKWSDESLSWLHQPPSAGAYNVNSFDVGMPQLHEIDVTSAIDLAQNTVTFKLYTESSGDLWFASKNWKGGKAVPGLKITLAI